MGPQRNSELFQAVAQLRLPSLREEYIRRNLLAETLKQLSELFEHRDNTSHPVTEPTLLLRLFALSQVQRSPMGISGFEPMLAVNANEQPNGGINAKAAPAHDQFGDNGSYFRTRVIDITMPNPDYGEMVEIFGINVYQPSTEELEVDIESERSNSLVVIGGTGKVIGPEKPITGETVVFAVRNKQTQDAKLYKVAFTEPEDIPLRTGIGVEYQSETNASVYLPDGRIVTVELLDGVLLQQALDEFQSASTELNLLLDPDSLLTEHGRAAIRETIAGTREDIS